MPSSAKRLGNDAFVRTIPLDIVLRAWRTSHLAAGLPDACIQIASRDLRSEICPSREERDRVFDWQLLEDVDADAMVEAERFPGA